MIEKYEHEGEGYNPFLITDNWQVAKLNFVSGQGVDEIQSIETHNQTDEVFILAAGRAVLITADKEDDRVGFRMHPMEQGIVYNVPKGVWHNIAMETDTVIWIVEDANTHLNDCIHYMLSDEQKKELYRRIAEALNEKS